VYEIWLLAAGYFIVTSFLLQLEVTQMIRKVPAHIEFKRFQPYSYEVTCSFDPSEDPAFEMQPHDRQLQLKFSDLIACYMCQAVKKIH
jgi:hypothetical protein